VHGAHFERGAAAKVVSDMVGAGRKFDLAVLDPPRIGAKDLMEPLARLEPSAIVYVSCDPATLARDLRKLVELGYRAERATPLDLMPQTAHVEVVVELAFNR
jgi:23S rRNA (uracil1939-C5)-methyltransferase